MTSLARMSVGLGATAAIGVLLAAPVGSGAERPSRIVDRTVICRTVGTGYPDPVRYMDVAAAPRLGENAPTVDIFNGHPPAGVHAGFRLGPYYGSDTGLMSVSTTRCKTTTVRVPLSGRGLRGGETALGNRYKCNVPARVLIRVRAVFRRPVTPRRARGQLSATGNIAAAAVVVAPVRSRRPLIYASSNDESGKTRIFVSRSACVPNQ